MNKKNFYVKGLYALILCLLLVSLLVFGKSFIEKKSTVEPNNKQQQNEIKVHNRTSAFEVTKSEIVGDELHLSLKNITNKGINAFDVLIGPEKGDGFGSYVEFTYSDIKDEISPNEIFVHREALVKEMYTHGVSLQAVFFTDGSSDGQSDVIREINETRQGTRVQLLKALELIQETLEVPQDEFSARVAALRTKISDLSTFDKMKSPRFNSGLKDGMGRGLLEIKNIQNKEDLIKVEEKLKRVVSRFLPTPAGEEGGRS